MLFLDAAIQKIVLDGKSVLKKKKWSLPVILSFLYIARKFSFSPFPGAHLRKILHHKKNLPQRNC